MLRWWWLVVVVGIAGCPGARTSGSLFPLEPGNYWKYEIAHAQPDSSWLKSTLEWRVSKTVPGDMGELRYLLEGRTEYFVERDGLVGYAVDDGLWTVHFDGTLHTGNSFAAALISDGLSGPQQFVPGPDATPKPPEMVAERSSGTKRLLATNITMTTPAGTFKRCVQVEHSRGVFRGVKTYAPGTGLIKSELYAKDGGDNVLSTQELIEYEVH